MDFYSLSTQKRLRAHFHVLLRLLAPLWISQLSAYSSMLFILVIYFILEPLFLMYLPNARTKFAMISMFRFENGLACHNCPRARMACNGLVGTMQPDIADSNEQSTNDD